MPIIISPRIIASIVFAFIFGLAPFTGAPAQDFPSRPVRFIVPYAPGGSGDLLARLLGSKLSAIWGQQVIVDNRPGAGGLIGTESAARSEPDGYTLYLATDGPLTVAATLHKRVPYDWKRDFAPVSLIAVGYQILIVSQQLPAKSLTEFIALAKQKPGALNYASIGIGTAPHLAAELFKSVAKIDLTHVPYRGSSAQAISALITGDVSMFMVGTSTAIGQVQAGTLRGLAVTASRRVEGLPDVPTFAETGLPDVDVKLWFAVLVPGGTPQPIIRRLHGDIAKTVADPEYKTALQMRGFEAISNTPEQLAEFLEEDYLKFRELIQKLGLQVE
jgi:tripartite-type tricarboxylate transporter receptor subunit TctC